MTISVTDIFAIGIGPSSSHTVGPMRAAKQFLESLDTHPARVSAELRGSLSATGRGHASDRALIPGLAGRGRPPPRRARPSPSLPSLQTSSSAPQHTHPLTPLPPPPPCASCLSKKRRVVRSTSTVPTRYVRPPSLHVP